MTTIMHKLARRAAAAESGPGAQHTDTAVPDGVRAVVVAIVDDEGEDVEVYAEAEPVITEQAAGHFLDSVADLLDDEKAGLGEYLYDIARIVAEETGEQYVRVLTTAYAHGRAGDMHEGGLTPRAAAYQLLAYVAKYTDDQDAAAEWTRLADEAQAAGR